MNIFLEQRNEVADFYAGVVANTFDLDIKEDLQECMVRDENLVGLWDEAITALSTGDMDDWKVLFGKAHSLSFENVGDCNSNGKLRAAGRQVDAWFSQFEKDGHEVAEAKYEERINEEWIAVKRQALAMRFNWETGFYFDAGKRLGNFWRIVMDEPQWVDIVPEPIISERYPLADFYAAYYDELMQVQLYDEIQDCLLHDDLHMDAYSGLITALAPYDDFLFEKNFAVIRTVEGFNWAKCIAQQPEVADTLRAHSNRWNAFWNLENSRELADQNAQNNASEFEMVIGDIQGAWSHADPIQAGRAYGHYQRMLTAFPEQ